MYGLYIHIPFCKSRCIYCGFYSTTLSGIQDQYIDALCKEMELRITEINKNDEMNTGSQVVQHRQPNIRTVYLGGGTPSQLSTDNLRRLFIYIYKVYDIDKGAEITMECNPDDITEEYINVMKECGINRVSMGAQTFCDSRLKFIHRRHTSEQVDKAVGMLRNAGIDNISIDMMFGFPDETIDEWQEDIDHALNLNVEHISAYSLMFEENTLLYNMLMDGKVKETDEEMSLAMYDMLTDRLTSAGYEHYEISNFARHGRRSKHNSSYWQGIPYIGIGAAAHSFDVVSRQWNIDDVNLYIESINNGIRPMESEVIDKQTRFNDMVMTALRTCEGIDMKRIEPEFGSEYEKYLTECAKRYIEQGQLKITDNRMRLTRKGIFISDRIMSDLMKIDDFED